MLCYLVLYHVMLYYMILYIYIYIILFVIFYNIIYIYIYIYNYLIIYQLYIIIEYYLSISAWFHPILSSRLNLPSTSSFPMAQITSKRLGEAVDPVSLGDGSGRSERWYPEENSMYHPLYRIICYIYIEIDI